jgi:transcription termination factor NusB
MEMDSLQRRRALLELRVCKVQDERFRLSEVQVEEVMQRFVPGLVADITKVDELYTTEVREEDQIRQLLNIKTRLDSTMYHEYLDPNVPEGMGIHEHIDSLKEFVCLLQVVENISNIMFLNMDVARTIVERKVYFEGLIDKVLNHQVEMDADTMEMAHFIYRREQTFCGECPICLEEGDLRKMVLLNCKHGIHFECLDSGGVLMDKCPLCTTSFKVDCIRLFGVMHQYKQE